MDCSAFADELFPTPRRIVDKMLSMLSDDALYFLDPSAGRGDIADAIRKRGEYSRQGDSRYKVDCIEEQPDLCALLAGKGHAIVGHDWMTYEGVSYYDAIVMNPPFSAGARHLLRAWDFLHAGEIVCLLNAETVRNPYSDERKRLVAIIAAHGRVEDFGQCFKSSARPTDVAVVAVYLKKDAEDDRVDLWATETAERDMHAPIDDPNLPATRDVLENKQRFYDEANRHMLLAFQHARKAATFLEANSISLSGHGERERYDDILKHAMSSSVGHNRAEFLRLHRKDAWLSVFNMMQFHKWLDKQQTEDLIRDVSQGGHFPFTVENIKGTLQNIVLQRRKLFEQSAWNVFQALTKYFDGNSNYHEGWKSNDQFKVNQKLVFPYGIRYEKDFGFNLWHNSNAIDIYNDLDRVLAVLDGVEFERVRTVGATLSNAIRGGLSSPERHTPRTVESTYFEIRYFKKGTVHLKWRRYDLLEKFNVTAAAGRNWIAGGHEPTRDAAREAPAAPQACDDEPAAYDAPAAEHVATAVDGASHDARLVPAATAPARGAAPLALRAPADRHAFRPF